MDLDRFDRQLLSLLQQDTRRSVETLAGLTGLSASAAHRRLQALRRAGVIQAEVALIDPKAVGYPLTLIVELHLEQERPEQLAPLRRWIAAEPAIQQGWYVTGEADFIMIVMAASMEGFDALMARLIADNQQVRKYKTSVALQQAKRGLTIPTDPP